MAKDEKPKEAKTDKPYDYLAERLKRLKKAKQDKQ